MTDNDLCKLATEAAENSYSPYSQFRVGAALLCTDGSVYTGCNIENASFTPTVCAERVAVFKAISDGKRDFAAIAISGGCEGSVGEKLCIPCGVCLQVLSEFCNANEFAVILANDSGCERYLLKELIPMSFKME